MANIVYQKLISALENSGVESAEAAKSMSMLMGATQKCENTITGQCISGMTKSLMGIVVMRG